MTRTVGDAQVRLRELEPARELMENKHFRDLIAGMDIELQYMERVPMKLRAEPDGRTAQMLERMGLDAPKTQEETLRLYIAIHAAVNYWQWKLGLVVAKSKEHEQLEKKINDAGRATVGTGRIVGARIQ